MNGEKKQIAGMFNLELYRVAKLVILVIAIPLVLQAIITDIRIHGYDPLWIWLRVGIVPIGLIGVWSYRFNLIKRYAALPILVVAFYVAAFQMYFVSQTGYEKSLYFHTYIQIFVALAILPFSWTTFLLSTGTIASSYIGFLLLFNDFNWSILSNDNLMFFKTYLLLSVVVFYFMRTTRSSLYKLTLKLSAESQNRQKIIDEQVDELAKARVSTLIADSAQSAIHDIKMPFNAVRMFIEAVKQLNDPEAIKKIAAATLPTINANAEKVGRMLYDMLDIERSVSVKLERVKPTEILDQALMELGQIRNIRDFTVTKKYDFTGSIDADREKLFRSIMNVLENAHDASEQHKEIWLRTSKSDSDSKIIDIVIGNQSYIPEDQQGKLFDRYFTDGKDRGTGLGLAIAKKFTTLQNGSISCSSNKEDGTEFTISLPLRQAKTLEVSESESPRQEIVFAKA